jgi:hypothetical protein
MIGMRSAQSGVIEYDNDGSAGAKGILIKPITTPHAPANKRSPPDIPLNVLKLPISNNVAASAGAQVTMPQEYCSAARPIIVKPMTPADHALTGPNHVMGLSPPQISTVIKTHILADHSMSPLGQ